MKNSFEINLNRKLQCESYGLLMTVSRFEGQNEFLAILKLFEEHGSVSKSTVNEELLSQPASSHYGQNVLSVVESYGLIKPSSKIGRFELTETGSYALEIKKIPFPSKDTFKVLISYDSLLPNEILDIGHIDSRDFTGHSERSIATLPEGIVEVLRKWSKKTITLPASKLETVVISEYSTTGIRTQYNSDYGVSLQIKYGEKPSLFLTGRSQVRLAHPKDLESIEIIGELMRDLGKLTVINGEPTLLVGASGLSISELRTFAKTFNLPAPRIEGYGTFSQTKVNNLRIFPTSLPEAKKWAWKLILDGLDHYIEEKQYDDLVQATCSKFESKYMAQDIAKGIPNYDMVLSKAKSGDSEFKDSFWYLVAPSDLSPGRQLDERN